MPLVRPIGNLAAACLEFVLDTVLAFTDVVSAVFVRQEERRLRVA